MIGERIRDKFAVFRKKGMWMGGWAPLGCEIKDRKLASESMTNGEFAFGGAMATHMMSRSSTIIEER